MTRRHDPDCDPMSLADEHPEVIEAIVDNYIYDMDQRIINGEFHRVNQKYFGIRSRQVAALITLLVEKGIL